MDRHPMHLHGVNFKVTETDGGQIPESAQQVETTVLVHVGSTRTIDFVADAPGDWPLHCHMTHHTMNQMGHNFPNLIGVDKTGLDQKLRKFMPGYMTMGEAGMGDMGEMGMPAPKNSLPMVGGPGPFAYIAMGGMFTTLKVRENLDNYEDPGWYQHPPGTVADLAKPADLNAMASKCRLSQIRRPLSGLEPAIPGAETRPSTSGCLPIAENYEHRTFSRPRNDLRQLRRSRRKSRPQTARGCVRRY